MQLAEVKRKLKLAWHLLLSRDYRRVRRTGAYDPAYMKQISPLLPLDPAEPLHIYMQKKGDDFLAEGELLEKGWIQFPDPHPFFDTAYYLCRYFPKGLQQNPYLHYLMQGWKEGLLPGPFFDEHLTVPGKMRLERCPLLLSAERSMEGLTGGWFDAEYYHDRNPALEAARGVIVRHYKLYGSKEGKSPCILFDPEYYLKQLDEERRVRAQEDPLSHYICALASGYGGNASPSPFFAPLSGCNRHVRPLTEENPYVGKKISRLRKSPLISVLVPIYRPALHHLNNCIRSVLYQTYPHWQLCLVDDGSQVPEVKERLLAWAKRDARIQVQFLAENSGIAEATNTAAAMATGEFLGFLDHDDELCLNCLEEMVAAWEESGADFLYTDEDLVGEDGTRLSLFRKPDYNPRLLLSHNYITHFVMVKRTLFEQAGGLNTQYDGAQDYDLMLKASEQAERVYHVGQLLYHWRATESSTSINHGGKIYADESGRKALAAALQRRGISGTATTSELNFFYRILPPAPPAPSHIFAWFLAGGEAGQEKKQLAASGAEVSVIASPLFGKVSSLCRAVDRVAGDDKFFVFIELPFTRLAENWLCSLQAAFLDENVGMVCARRKFAGGDGPSYLLPDLSRHSTSFFAEFLSSHSLHANGMHCLQDMLCPGSGLIAVRSALFHRYGGLREKYPLLALSDLALRLRKAGYGVVYTPDAWIDFPQGKTVLPDDSGEEKSRFQEEWHQELRHYSHYYNQGQLADAGISVEDFLSWFLGRAWSAQIALSTPVSREDRR